MKGISIRPMMSADKAAVEHICIETAPPFLCSNDKRREYTLLMYNRYYTRVLQHSFVVVDTNDKPVGYILCAPDYKSYKQDFYRNELADIRRLGIFYSISARSEVCSVSKYAKKYPAHLHIDILPAYQGRHIGKELMNALFHHLKEQHISGLMLSVSRENKGAIAFYEKCGFRVLSKGAGLVYGMKL